MGGFALGGGAVAGPGAQTPTGFAGLPTRKMPHDPADAKQPMGQTQEQKLKLYTSLVDGAPKASVVVITPARHFVMLDQPEPFYKAVSESLASIP